MLKQNLKFDEKVTETQFLKGYQKEGTNISLLPVGTSRPV